MLVNQVSGDGGTADNFTLAPDAIHWVGLEVAQSYVIKAGNGPSTEAKIYKARRREREISAVHKFSITSRFGFNVAMSMTGEDVDGK